MTQASGKIPQISVVLGPAAGGAAYGPALTDVVILGPEGRIFVTGPDVVRSVTGEDVDMLRLGGPEPHGRRSGVVHILTETEAEALDEARTVASLLGSQGQLDVDRSRTATSSQLLPESTKRAYDVHPLVDGRARRRHRCSELHERWAPNIVTTLGRLGGRTVGVIANNPLRLGGCLDSLVGREGLAVRPDVRRVRRARSSCSSTCPATCPASARSGTASYAAAPSCCTRSPSASCPG